MKSAEKLKNMRIDIRMGLTAQELADKYKISVESARNYRSNYLKVIQKQKNLERII